MRFWFAVIRDMQVAQHLQICKIMVSAFACLFATVEAWQSYVTYNDEFFVLTETTTIPPTQFAALNTFGPLSVCVNAGSWNSYTGGIFSPVLGCSGAESKLDHCVQLVGYDTAQQY